MISFKRCLAAGAAGAVLLLATGAAAQVRDYNVPALPIGQAVTELARQAGVQISAPTSHLGGVRAPAVNGRMDFQDALDRLIAGTDLEVVDREGAVITLRRRTEADRNAAQVDDVVVVGSRIVGTRINEALPVTVIDSDELDAIGAVDGDDLFRSIAQVGDVGFNDADTDNGGINNARGDVASIDLRSIGTGNTLVLLNGRRLVPHPGTQVESFVPVQTVNTNAIPTMGLRRVEVLADGAAALYGTDAVAGVVNNVLRSNFEGFTAQAGIGADRGGMEEYSFSFQAGKDFNDGRTNISIMGDYLTRDPLYIWERDYATVAGRVARFNGRATGLDYGTYSTITAWAEGIRLNPTTYQPANATTRVNGQTLTAAAGTFHIQPKTNPGCLADGFIAGTCFDNSTLATTTEDSNLRYDLDTMRTISSAVDRVNVFTFVNHEFNNGVEFFGELGYYQGTTWSQRQQDTPLDTQRVLMSPTAYWNPLGAVGVTARLPGLTTGTGTTAFPAGGAAVQIQDFRFADLGYRTVDVENVTLRYLGGLRGEFRGFDWETAVLYSKASTEDVMDGISMTGLQAALNMTTPAAYNPFVGGDLNSPKDGVVGLNQQSTIDSMLVKVYRKAETELALWDMKVSKGDLFAVPAGHIGFAGGVEARRETFMEDRDPRLDGTITFTDLAGGGSQTDVMGVSYTPDSSGARNVYSAFAELAVPVVSPEMNIPLVKSIDMQFAARIENYSLFGTVWAPKVALAYRPTDWLMFRSAWSKGFRAPNLLQLHQPDFERSNSRRDYAACAVQLAIGAIPTLVTSNDYCTSEDRIEQRTGNKDLKAEDSDNLSLGLVLEPTLWPREYGSLTFTADYWKIRQENLVGIFGGHNQLLMDYYLRQIGQTNPNLVRAAPDAQQIADAAAAGLAPVGTLLSIKDEYVNLQPRESEGLDLRMFYSLRNTPAGSFRLSVNASQKLKRFQEASEAHQMLLDALQDGVISGVTVSGVEDLVRRNGRPEWKVTASLTWSKGPFTSGWYTSYVSDFYDTTANDATTGDYWMVEEWMTHNLYVQFEFDKGPLANTRVRIGARNLFDEDPPLTDDRFGFNGSVHSNRGRWLYATIRKEF
ncbi:MAG: TonB-dependent receptor [Bordetella sp.]|nr:TonB-dependent receptor [Bordetella sp.]